MRILLHTSAAIFFLAFLTQFILLWDQNKAGKVQYAWLVPVRLAE